MNAPISINNCIINEFTFYYFLLRFVKAYTLREENSLKFSEKGKVIFQDFLLIDILI